MDEPIFDPFLNVRKGGPKEKRIRRVELMGEHSPKPIYYIKVSQSMEDDFIDDEIFYDYFSEKYVVDVDKILNYDDNDNDSGNMMRMRLLP